jgi:hypothetical protein
MNKTINNILKTYSIYVNSNEINGYPKIIYFTLFSANIVKIISTYGLLLGSNLYILIEIFDLKILKRF